MPASVVGGLFGLAGENGGLDAVLNEVLGQFQNWPGFLIAVMSGDVIDLSTYSRLRTS